MNKKLRNLILSMFHIGSLGVNKKTARLMAYLSLADNWNGSTFKK